MSRRPLFKQPPLDIDREDRYNQIVRCSLHSGDGFRVSVGLKQEGHVTSAPTYTWESLEYDAVIDHDNTTVVFIKGLNLRPDRVSDASRFECLYGWDFSTSKHLLKSDDVVSLAQEIVRCQTPLSVLTRSKRGVLKNLADPYTGLLPWQEGYQKHVKRKVMRRRPRRRRKHRGYL